jgi:hypothetical protein
LKFIRRILDRKTTISVIGLFAMLVVPTLVTAIDPTVVTLLYFRGEGLDNMIRLEWATGTEFDTAGFRLERSAASWGPYTLLDDIGFVPSEAPPDGLSGAEYVALDESSITNGMRYWYRLVEIESNGVENRTDPISVTAGLAQPTSTPISAPTSTPTFPATAGTTAVQGASPTTISTIQSGTATNSVSTLLPTPISDSAAPTTRETEATRTRQTELASAAGEGSEVSDNLLDSPSVQSTSSGYPAPDVLSTPLPSARIGDEGYPGNHQDTIRGLPDAYPFVPENTRQARALIPQNDSSSATGPAAIGQANSNDSSNTPGQSEQEPAATLMLWVGFLAALVIFIAAVVGSAYIYRRQSPK